MIALTLDAVEEPAVGATPWVLVVISDYRKRCLVRSSWEVTGFAVEVATRALDALECLKVMTPTFVVLDDWVHRPARR